MVKKLSTDPYKGVRDFYPDDMAVQNHIFSAMRRASESFGYEEYAASILEPAELYESKTSDEIVNEQTYTFIDRGERKVTLRPEMTPSVARMVAGKRRELAFPLRWYSIQNFFRYERPQRGREREFWQLNCDLFGVEGVAADAEIITVAASVMKELGASEDDFEIHVSDRTILDTLYRDTDKKFSLGLAEETHRAITRLLDKRVKIDDFEQQLSTLLNGNSEAAAWLIKELESRKSNPSLEALRARLAERGVNNVIIDTSITRGFDYYTGMVFEVFDTDPQNKRAMFGGGRYDRLLELFGDEKLPAVGFAMGDVTARDFLDSHGLLNTRGSTTDLYIAPVTAAFVPDAEKLADELRRKGARVAIGLTDKKVGDQVKVALKKSIPFFAAFGEEERGGNVRVKHLETEQEESLTREDLAEFLIGKRA
jgi:histidyl-tRNA synthetase